MNEISLSRINDHLDEAYKLITLIEADDTYKSRIRRGYELMRTLDDIHEIVSTDGLCCESRPF